jgi:lipoprotein signal peptidase
VPALLAGFNPADVAIMIGTAGFIVSALVNFLH